MTDVSRVLGSLESEVMRIMWAEQRSATVRAILERLNRDRSEPLAYTTVMTVMSRLADKGILARERRGRGYAYQTAVPDAATIAVRGVVRDFGEAALAGFVSEARSDPRLLRRLRKLLD